MNTRLLELDPGCLFALASLSALSAGTLERLREVRLEAQKGSVLDLESLYGLESLPHLTDLTIQHFAGPSLGSTPELDQTLMEIHRNLNQDFEEAFGAESPTASPKSTSELREYSRRDQRKARKEASGGAQASPSLPPREDKRKKKGIRTPKPNPNLSLSHDAKVQERSEEERSAVARRTSMQQ